MTNIQSKSLIPFCQFIDKSVIHVSIFNMHCVRQLLIHFLYIDGYTQGWQKPKKPKICCCDFWVFGVLLRFVGFFIKTLKGIQILIKV